MDKLDILGIAKKINPAISLESNLFTDGFYNSIEMISLVVMLEEKFGIEISPMDISVKNFNTIDSIAKYVEKCLYYKANNISPAIRRKGIKRKKKRKKASVFHFPQNAKTVLDFLENAAAQKPRKIAMYDKYGNKMTFQRILHNSKAIGTYIQKKYKCKGKPFIVLERRNVKCLVMFLGVIWSGNYYVSLDERFEKDRLDMMIDIVKPEGILWHYSDKNENVKAMETDLYDEMIEEEPDFEMLEEIKNGYQYDDPLYGVYTSGTTGTPKCIIKSHGAMVDFITNYVHLFGFNHNDILGSKLSLMFDAITKDMYTTFYCGARMHIMSRGAVLPPDDAKYIQENEITSVVWSPSLLINFAKLHVLENLQLDTLKRVLFVGEALPAKYMNYWIEHKPDIMFVNLYGTSEMTGNCLYQIVKEPVTRDVVPLNAVYPGYDVFLLDDENHEVHGVGAVGEICAGGPLIAINQLGRPMDPEKFVVNPLPDPKSDRIYKTGDIVKIAEDGAYVFLSRKDYCFKHAGYRIEPGEVEGYFNRLDYIDVAICLYDDVSQRIIIFWQGDHSKEEELYEYANSALPTHMLPGKYVFMDKMPLNRNGKVDKAKLMNWIKQTKGECDENME